MKNAGHERSSSPVCHPCTIYQQADEIESAALSTSTSAVGPL